MKRGLIITLIIVLVVIVLAVVGYLIIHSQNSPYKLSSTNIMNPVDYVFPGGIKQTALSYYGEGANYNILVLEFENEQGAINGISNMTNQYNPAMIGLAGKYVKFKEESPGNYMYFYKSGKNIIFIENFVGDKNLADSFITWLYSKYPNK